MDATLWFTKGGYSGIYPFADEARCSGAKFVNLGFIVEDSREEWVCEIPGRARNDEGWSLDRERWGELVVV